MIAREIIDKVLDRADIVDVISQFVQLKKKGQNYEACCPFHQEKTPSFKVSPVRQSWHCFGACAEGGDVVSFVMKHQGYTYPEAIKWLAQRYNIEVEERQESAEAMQERLRKEAMQALVGRVAQFYRSLLYLPENKSALDYATSRWNKDYVSEEGIGFAPNAWNRLYEWALQKGESIEMLEHLGLLKRRERDHSLYDAYRNRLMIPIRDRYKNIIGFTARDLSGDENCAKYINSMESDLYHKSRSIFGIDEAYRAAMREGIFYLVEGAPDAMKMHSVGINNAVAPLGGAWTDNQFQMLKKVASTVCFINDADPAPRDKEWGPGIEYVLRNGELALKCGLAVTVRELPLGEDNSKQDPDSFFIDKSRMRDLEEEDFVAWAASKFFKNNDNPQRKSENIRRVSELASYINDDTLIEMLLGPLNKFYKGKEFWRNSINKAKWEREKTAEQKKNGVDLRQYGFYCENGAYMGLSDKGGDVQWSNFTMKPLFHIKDSDSPKRLFYFKNCHGREDIVEMTMEDLNSCSKFRQKIEGIGNYIWMGGEREMIKLKNYLYDQTETAQIIKQMGWHTVGFYAWGNGIFINGSFHKADDFGIVRLGDTGNFYIPAASKLYRDDRAKFERERQFIHQNINKIKIADYFQQFVEVFGDNGKIGLAFWVASLFHDIIYSHTLSFPILDLFGPKGSGKTRLGSALMKFFVCGDQKAPNLKNSTNVALNDDVAFSSNALVHLDEYKNDIDSKRIEFLKGLYDCVGRTKMAGSGFDSRIMTSVKSAVIISGQELPTADIALFHRCIWLSFPRSEFTIQQRQKFAALTEVQQLGLTHITLEVLKCRNRVEGNFRDYYEYVQDDINKRTNYAKLETRIVENWAKIVAAFRCVEDIIPFPFDYENLITIAINGIMMQNKMSGEGNEISKFWEIVNYLRDNGDIFNEGDYKIKPMVSITTDVMKREFPAARNILLLNTSRIFQLYKRTCVTTQAKALPDDALKEYLKNADYYLGCQKSVRFKSIIRGVQEVDAQGSKPGELKKVSRVLKAMAFDYDAMKDQFDMSLDMISD